VGGVTHAELCQRAAKWLKRQSHWEEHHKSGCGVVVTETSPGLGERPDAIGFTSNNSYLVEAKTSRADFRADFKKPWREFPETGMGCYRFFICVPDLISVEELPDGWGLLYCHPHKIEIIKGSERFDCKDHSMLYSLIRRAVCQGFNPQERYKDWIEKKQVGTPSGGTG
jgi:hypothetical protein